MTLDLFHDSLQKYAIRRFKARNIVVIYCQSGLQLQSLETDSGTATHRVSVHPVYLDEIYAG